MAARAPSQLSDPQEVIIAATEALLAEHGPQRATVRAITQAAGVNVAAINYHFGSRDGLMTAICARHMRASNDEMLDRLARLDVQPGAAFVKAIFAPLVSTALTVWMHDAVLRGLRSFIFVDATLAHKLNVSQMSEVYQRMQDALAQACPDLSAEQIRRRFGFAMATIMQVVRSHDANVARGDSEGLVDDLLSFVCGGFATEPG